MPSHLTTDGKTPSTGEITVDGGSIRLAITSEDKAINVNYIIIRPIEIAPLADAEKALQPTLKGDANLDNNVNIADAVLVMQVATNPDKYAQGKSDSSITAQGEVNADVDGKKGLTNSDALLIQKFKLGLISSFDE